MLYTIVIWVFFILAQIFIGPDLGLLGCVYWSVFGGVGLLLAVCGSVAKDGLASKLCRYAEGFDIPYWFVVILIGGSLFGWHPICGAYAVMPLRALWLGVRRYAG